MTCPIFLFIELTKTIKISSHYIHELLTTSYVFYLYSFCPLSFLFLVILCLFFMFFFFLHNLFIFFLHSQFTLCTFILWIICLLIFPWFVIICTLLLHKCLVFLLILLLHSCSIKTLHSCDPFLYKHYVFLCYFNL